MRLDVACSHIVDCEHKTAPIDESGSFFAVGTPAMKGHHINYGDARRISRETFDLWTRRLRPAPGDLLLAREAPVGPIVQLPDEANVAPGQRTVLLRPNPQVADSRFLYYALSSPPSQVALQVKAEGSTVHHLNVPDIRSFELNVPPLREQQAIAEVLGVLDDKIAANTALVANCWAIAEAEHSSIQREDGAHQVALSEVAGFEYGKSLPATAREDGTVVVVGSGGVSGTHTQALVEQSGVVVGRKGSAGSVIWVSGPHFPIDTTFFVRATREVYSQPYLYFLLRKLGLDGMNNDSAVPGLNRTEALATPVRVPSDLAIEMFTAIAEPLIAIVDAANEENRALAATRDALLPQLMSGKLRVRDAERIAEEAGV